MLTLYTVNVLSKLICKGVHRYQSCQLPAAELDAFSQLSCCAFEGNPLGLRAGEPFILSLTFAESTVAANLGIAITDVGAFALHATTEASRQPARKARSKMELVSITDEKGYAR